jgi:hypothetical protein
VLTAQTIARAYGFEFHGGGERAAVNG